MLKRVTILFSASHSKVINDRTGLNLMKHKRDSNGNFDRIDLNIYTPTTVRRYFQNAYQIFFFEHAIFSGRV